ncbi:MAG: thiamine phosphate synthase [Fibromonadaceae bacterium]|jgi:thiamine-phosphate pyrophosphorylase|nr:thiamine phosphate synthase [Fibromonadaceae bacterium]
MRLSLITSPENFADEHDLVENMFELGLESLFVRKPSLPEDLVERWSLGIKYEWHEKLLPWQGSAHSFEELKKINRREIVLLGPVFDSISKHGYKSKFLKCELKEGIAEWREFIGKENKTKLYALGGIDAENICELEELGFDGAAILGGVWNYADPVGAFERILSAMPRPESPSSSLNSSISP